MINPKIAIIPGNANNLTCNFGIKNIRAEDWQFLSHNDCSQLVWGDDKKFGFWESVNPLAYLINYLHEKKQIQDPAFIVRLKEFLESTEPEVIICHSMGCLFLANYLQSNNLPTCVQKIVLLQGDIDRLTEFKTTLPIVASYCFWDYTLWVSVILNRYCPIGLFGSKKVNKNKFLFLPLPQPHAQVTNQLKMINRMIDSLDN